KIYPTLEVTRLPRDFDDTGMPALAAIAPPVTTSQVEAIPDLETLAQLLFFSAGVIKSKKHAQGETFFRAAACTGALYEIELYFACTDLPAKGKPNETALTAGLYHFGAAEFGLRQLRAGDFRQVLVEATANDPVVAHAPVVIICTGTYWRNAWKYRSRAYRHFGWDNGTILANLLAMCEASKLPAKIVAGFIDGKVNGLLGLDIKRESAFSIVTIGHTEQPMSSSAPLEVLELPVVAYSEKEVDYPAMRKMHDASSFESADEINAWRGKTLAHVVPTAKEGIL